MLPMVPAELRAERMLCPRTDSQAVRKSAPEGDRLIYSKPVSG